MMRDIHVLENNHTTATPSSLSFLEMCLQKKGSSKVQIHKCRKIKIYFHLYFFFSSKWMKNILETQKKTQHSDDLFACPVYWNQNCQVFIC